MSTHQSNNDFKDTKHIQIHVVSVSVFYETGSDYRNTECVLPSVLLV